MKTEIKQVSFDSAEYGLVWQLREDILRMPIGLSLKDEDVTSEKNEVILAAYKDKKLVGCILLKPMDIITMKFRQMAVENDFQGKGIGKELMEEAEKISWKKGFEQIVLHARKTAVAFYEKLGYQIVSDEFEEVGIPHFAMEKHKP